MTRPTGSVTKTGAVGGHWHLSKINDFTGLFGWRVMRRAMAKVSISACDGTDTRPIFWKPLAAYPRSPRVRSRSQFHRQIEPRRPT